MSNRAITIQLMYESGSIIDKGISMAVDILTNIDSSRPNH